MDRSGSLSWILNLFGSWCGVGLLFLDLRKARMQQHFVSKNKTNPSLEGRIVYIVLLEIQPLPKGHAQIVHSEHNFGHSEKYSNGLNDQLVNCSTVERF